VAKGKKKTKQLPKGGAKQQQLRQGEKQRDMRKVRCFACNQLGHCAGQCPKKKKKKLGGTATTTEEEFSI
jgi:radical SAM protein with 4Fe4S-binding SPASM domain